MTWGNVNGISEALWFEYRMAQVAAEDAETNEMTREQGLEMLAAYRESGATHVSLIGADTPCPACADAMRRSPYAIGNVPRIPISGCTSGFCRCDHLPA